MVLGTFASHMDVAGWLLMILLWGAFLAVVLWAITRLFPSAGPLSDQAAQLPEPVAIGDVAWDGAANVPTLSAGAGHG